MRHGTTNFLWRRSSMEKRCLRQLRPRRRQVEHPRGGAPFFRALGWPTSPSPSQWQTSLRSCEPLGAGSFSGVNVVIPSARGSDGLSLSDYRTCGFEVKFAEIAGHMQPLLIVVSYANNHLFSGQIIPLGVFYV